MWTFMVTHRWVDHPCGIDSCRLCFQSFMMSWCIRMGVRSLKWLRMELDGSGISVVMCLCYLCWLTWYSASKCVLICCGSQHVLLVASFISHCPPLYLTPSTSILHFQLHLMPSIASYSPLGPPDPLSWCSISILTPCLFLSVLGPMPLYLAVLNALDTFWLLW